MSSAAGTPGAIAIRSCGAKRAAVYQRRRPERTAAYQVVRQNLETWLAQRRVGGLDPGSDFSVHPVPAYVGRDLLISDSKAVEVRLLCISRIF